MPTPKKYKSQPVALADADRLALTALATELNKTNSEVARDAIRWYVQHHETLRESERSDKLAKVIFKCTDRIIAVIQSCTNRICSLQVRSIIDSNITMMLLYRALPENQADDVFKKMYRMAVTRVMRQVSPEELDIAKMIKMGLEQQIFDEEAATQS